MQLTVIKSDGTEEVYRHTKVLGAMAAALSDAGLYQPHIAEELSEAVTLYLKHQYGCGQVTFDEIYAMLQAVLTDTGYDRAAECLHDHHVQRQIKRSRIEVFSFDTPSDFRPWNKSIVVQDLIQQRHIEYDLARSVAGTVEETAMRMDCRALSTDLIGALVRQELAAMRSAVAALDMKKPAMKFEQIEETITPEAVAAAC